MDPYLGLPPHSTAAHEDIRELRVRNCDSVEIWRVSRPARDGLAVRRAVMQGLHTRPRRAWDHRIRENTSRHKTESYETVANRSILETIHPSLATQLCATLVMVAILLLGGQTTTLFIATMLVGTLSGAFFSIFIAVPLLVAWEKSARRRAAARATA